MDSHLTLLYGPANPRKTDDLFRRCCDRIQTLRGDSFIYLVPSRRRAEHLRRRLLVETGGEVLVAPFIFGLTSFLARLYSLCPSRKALMPASASRLFVEDILKENVSYFRHARREPFSGLAAAMAALIAELRTFGISADELEGTFEGVPGLQGPKGQELIRIYRVHQERLGDLLVDPEGIPNEIQHGLEEDRFREHFPEVDLLIVDGFDVFTPPLVGILDRLFGYIPESYLVLDHVPHRDKVFGHLYDTFEHFRTRAAEIRSVDRSPDESPGALLEPHLFEDASIPPTDPGGRVTLVPCPDRTAEVEEIARRIRHLTLDEQVKPSHICVAFQDVGRYAPLIREIFPRYGLPYTLSAGHILAQCPVAIATLSILECILNGYARRDLLRLLNLPYIHFMFESSGEEHLLSDDELDTWSRRLSAVSGRTGWLDALRYRAEWLDERVRGITEGTFDREAIDDPEKEALRLEDRRSRLLLLIEGLSALFDTLAPLEGEMSLETFRKRLLEVIERLGILQCIRRSDIDLIGEEVLERDIRAFYRFSEVLDELVFLAPFLVRKTFPLRTRFDLLRATLADASYTTDQDDDCGVQVLGLLELRGVSFEHLFLGGLVEGAFPSIPRPDIFLPDETRAALGLPSREEVLCTDRFLFYQAVLNPTQSLTLLYPESEGEDILVTSPFVDEIRRITGRPDDAPDDALPPQTRSDLHRWLGRALMTPAGTPEAAQVADQIASLSSNPTWADETRSLLHGLMINDQRTRRSSPGPYEGILDRPDILERLRRRFGPNYPFSITQLERYALCPFSFFVERVLDIAPLQDPEEDLSALDRGNLIHHILYRFYSERRSAAGVEPVTFENIEAARERLQEILHEEVEALSLQGFFWEMEVHRIALDDPSTGREGLLSRFLRTEAEQTERLQSRPALFELSFGGYPGIGERDPRSSTQPYTIHGEETVRITGKIDRVDHTDNGIFLVLDYKTGRSTPSQNDIQSGHSLQLPIYILAVEELLSDQISVGAGGGYYQVRDSQNCGKKGYFTDQTYTGILFEGRSGALPPEAFRDALNRTRDHVLRYARGIRTGHFPITGHDPDQTCRYCGHRHICRVDP